MRPRRGLAPVLAAAALVAGAACGPDGRDTVADDAAAITIGTSLSLSGSVAREGALTQQGYELCRQVVNDKGGIPQGDRRVRMELTYQDDRSEPATAAQLIERFDDRGIKLVLGPHGSATTEAAAAVIEQNNQVMVDSSGTDDTIFAQGRRRTFGVLSPARQHAASLLQALADLDARPRTVAFLTADDRASKAVTRGGIAKAGELGIDVVGDERVRSGSAGASWALSKIRPRKPDVIVVSAPLAEAVAAIGQARELGVRPAGGFAGTVAPPAPDFVEELGPRAEGVIWSTPWTATLPGEDAWFGTARDFNGAFKERFAGRAPEHTSAMAAAGCLALVLALERAGTAEPDRVRDALAALDVESFFGPIRFSPQGQNLAKPTPVIQIQDGMPVTVWPAGAAEAPLRPWPAR